LFGGDLVGKLSTVIKLGKKNRERVRVPNNKFIKEKYDILTNGT